MSNLDGVVPTAVAWVCCLFMPMSIPVWRRAALGLLPALAVLVNCRTNGANEAPTTQPVPRRIITLAPNAAEIIAALGMAQRLVAVSDFCVHPPELASRPRIGGLFNPDLEAIIQLKPDLVVLRGRSPALERLCGEKAVRVYHDPTERLDDIGETIRELGDILDCPQNARALAARMHHRLNEIKAAVAGRPRPRVFVTIGRKPDALSSILTASRGTFVDEIITCAGGVNVFADLAIDYPQVSPEAVLAARPEVIIEAMPESDASPELDRKVRTLWRQLGPIPATQHDRVYVLSEDNVLIPSPRIVDVIARLALLLHPEADID